MKFRFKNNKRNFSIIIKQQKGGFPPYFVGTPRFELRMTAPKTVVLPLHHVPIYIKINL